MSIIEKNNYIFSRGRTQNAKRNLILSISYQLILFIFSFATRTIFIKLLGEDYLGINGLFSNILSFLSLADLGINTILLFALYKPVAESDVEKVKSLILFSKKIYRLIAIGIYTIGIFIIPFLPFIINGSALPFDELKNYYILYLVNVVFSYLVVYKTTLIKADQRMHIIKLFDFVTSLLVQIAQIILLIYTRNYLLYLLIMVFFTLAKNIILSFVANKIYPFLKEKNTKNLTNNEKDQIYQNLKSVFLYRVSGMIMNSTDNILISIILGTLIVGYYSNYLLIISAINLFISLLVQGVSASVGNYNATKSSAEKLKLFRSLLLIFYFIGALCSACFITMFNDFIYLWIGYENSSYMLSTFDVGAITFNFFVSCILNPVWMFRETAGQFKQVKYVMAYAAIINIVLSFVLGNFFGLGGIIVSTAISKLLTLFWFEPKILFKNVFKDKKRKYWFWIFKQFLISVFCLAVCVILCNFLPCDWLFVFVKIGICSLITTLCFCVLNFKTEEFNYVVRLLKRKNK